MFVIASCVFFIEIRATFLKNTFCVNKKREKKIDVIRVSYIILYCLPVKTIVNYLTLIFHIVIYLCLFLTLP